MVAGIIYLIGALLAYSGLVYAFYVMGYGVNKHLDEDLELLMERRA